MVTRRKGLRVVLLLLLSAAAPASAQRLSEPSFFAGTTGSGARALGMGGAFIAVADDATASSWNPAGLCVLERAEASIVYQPLARISSQYPAETFTIDSVSSNPSSSNVNHEVELDDAYDVPRNSRSLDFVSFTLPLRAG